MIDEPLEDDDGIDDLLATAEALAPSAPRTWVSPAKASGAPRDSSSLFGDQEAEAAAFAHAAETGHDTSALGSPSHGCTNPTLARHDRGALPRFHVPKTNPHTAS